MAKILLDRMVCSYRQRKEFFVALGTGVLIGTMAMLGAKAVSASGNASGTQAGQIRGLRRVRSSVYSNRTSYAFDADNGLQVGYLENDDSRPFFDGTAPMNFLPPPSSPPGFLYGADRFVPPSPVANYDGYGMQQANQPMPRPQYTGAMQPGVFADVQPMVPQQAPHPIMPVPSAQMPTVSVYENGYRMDGDDSGTLTAEDINIVQSGKDAVFAPVAVPAAVSLSDPVASRIETTSGFAEEEFEYHQIPVVDFTMDVRGISDGTVGVGPVMKKTIAKPVKKPQPPVPVSDVSDVSVFSGQSIHIDSGDYSAQQPLPSVRKPTLTSSKVKFGEMRLNFKSGSADLSMSNIRWLQEFSEFAAVQGRGQPIEIRISMENPQLQARRLALVKNAMRSSGVSESRLMSMETGRGEDSFVITLLPRPENEFGGAATTPVENIW